MEKYLIFGCGRCAEIFLNAFGIEPKNVVGFVESKKSNDILQSLRLSKFDGKKIFSVDEVKELDFDKIIIANQHYNTIEEVLNLGIPEEKIFIANKALLDEHRSKNPDKKVKSALPFIFTPKLQSKRIYDEKIFSFEDGCFITSEDYVRIGMLQLLSDEIKTRKISGDVAEFGVFQGFFAKFINEFFPDRTLHLFDTFEGFDKKDESIDLQNNFVDENTIDQYNTYFKNTSVDFVMSQMKYPEKVELHRGYFPDTIPAEEKTFAFVSLDVDLYQPTLEGLRYFYPRLSTGGFIMVHDYSDIDYSLGIRQAVEDFEKEFGRVIKIPLVDRYGSLVIAK